MQSTVWGGAIVETLFGKNRTHDFRTSRCAGYLLDHSGDDCTWRIQEGACFEPQIQTVEEQRQVNGDKHTSSL